MRRGLFVLVVLLAGCRAGSGYVLADRETFAAVAPEFLAYVASDRSLGSRDREFRERTVESWRARLVQAGAWSEAAPGGD